MTGNFVVVINEWANSFSFGQSELRCAVCHEAFGLGNPMFFRNVMKFSRAPYQFLSTLFLRQCLSVYTFCFISELTGHLLRFAVPTQLLCHRQRPQLGVYQYIL